MAKDRQGPRVVWGTMIAFAITVGVLSETVELLHIQAGGIAPPTWALRGVLVAAYTVIAAIVLLAATVVVPRRAVPVAAVACTLVALLPWLNFALLPRIASLRSLIGNVAAVLLVAVVVPVVVRWRRSVVVAAAGLALAVNVWPAISRRDARPVTERTLEAEAGFNVVLVLIDTLRADHLGAYGYRRPTSPHFDAVAADGTLFERTTAQAPWTKPAVASLMTGVFVHRHGVISSRDALGPDRPTLADEMGRRGYRTAAFSANPWITPEFRFDRGFDEFESGRAMGAQLTNLYKVLRRLDRALGARGISTKLANWAFWGRSANVSNSERDRSLTDAVVEWIARQGASPYFLYVHLIGPHDPYDPPLEYARRFHPPGWDGQVGRTVPPARVQTVFDDAEPLTSPEIESLVAQYDGAVAYADAQLGRIVDALQRAGQLDRTLLVVTADHGEEFYEHRNWRHGNQLYSEVVHVPLAFRLPGTLPAARRGDLSMTVDVFPTILSLTGGGRLPDELDGRPLFAAADSPPDTAFAEHWWLDGGTYVSRMVQQGSLKLQESRDETSGKERTELYDLVADRREQRNLLENPEPVSDKSMGELRSLLARFGDRLSVASAVSVDVDPSTKERLRQLGY